MTEHQPTAGRWPDGAIAAVSLTMDNMGEAYELESGSWPSTVPVGRHHSVLNQLPLMLDIFERHRVHGTYFIEAWNTDVYPDAIREVADRGHEIGLHGFRHEPWSGLEPAREEELVARSVARFAELGVRLAGFRPPGGGLNPDSLRILSNHGFDYVSPAGQYAGSLDGVTVLPFRWEWIDAFCYFPPLAPLREKAGLSPDLLDPATFARFVEACLDEVVATGQFAALLFHPFLHGPADRLAVMDELVRRVADDSRLWCAPCDQVAAWVRDHPEDFAADPGLIDNSWLG